MPRRRGRISSGRSRAGPAARSTPPRPFPSIAASTRSSLKNRCPHRLPHREARTQPLWSLSSLTLLCSWVSRSRLLGRRASPVAMASSSSELRPASRRIVDYLNDGEELGAQGAAVETPPCSPAAVAVGKQAKSALPRFRWPRLVRLRREGGGDEGKPGVVVEKGDDLHVAAASTSGACVLPDLVVLGVHPRRHR